MFRRATIQGSKGIAKTSPVVIPSFRQWQMASSHARLRRAYSTEANPASEGAEDAREEPQQRAEDARELAKEVESLKKEVGERTKEAKDFKDRLQRAVADFRNLQGRTEREKRIAKDFAIQSFAKDIVESVDNLDRALSAVPEESRTEANKDLLSLYNGLKMTEEVFLNALKRHGLEKIDPMGEVFDPNRHEAVFQAPMPDKDPNTVFNVQQTGFSLNGRTIRAAKVGIVAAAE